MNEPLENRRKHARVYRNFILSYHRKGKSASAQDISQVNDISKGGMNFLATQPFDPEISLVLDLKTPFIADSIRLEGCVLECREKIPGMIYEIRLQFKDVSEGVLEVLERIERYSNAEDN